MEATHVTFEEFKKLDMRVGTIVNVEHVKRTERLYKIQVDLGELGVRQTVSSLVGCYTPDELKGRKIIYLVNLKPAKFSGEMSEGMLLAAEKGEELGLLCVDRDMDNGARVT